MYLYNGKKINLDAPVTHKGITYANIRSPEVRELLGVIEVPDPEYPQPADEYFVTENDDGSLNITRKSDEQIAQQNQAKVNAAAKAYLFETDWYATRFAETGVAIPDEVKLKRQEARDSIIHLGV